MLPLILRISESSVKLNEVRISAERSEMKTEVKAAAIKITKQDMEMIPSIGGEPDLAQYMQVIPGVVFTGDQGGQLYIRGGSPIQNKVLLDGMTIYSPFHSIGLFSVFDTDIIRNTDVYTGGFSAEYGGRISSIMDIKTIDGNKKEFGGKVSANTFGSKLFIEGPLLGNEKSSFIFSGKTSYLDKSSRGPAARQVGRRTAELQEGAGPRRPQRGDDGGAGGEAGVAGLHLGASERWRSPPQRDGLGGAARAAGGV